MPQITLYIPKVIDEAWRAASQPEREALTAAMRRLLARRLPPTAAERREAVAENAEAASK